MDTILQWTWPHEERFRFYIVQLFFWVGYFFLVGLIGTFPYRATKYRQTPWTTLVLGAMGPFIAYLSQFLFKLDHRLDIISPYAIVVSIATTVFLAPFVSIFAFVCRGNDEFFDELDHERTHSREYNDDTTDEIDGIRGKRTSRLSSSRPSPTTPT